MRQLSPNFNHYRILICIVGLIIVCQAFAKEMLRPLAENDLAILAVFFILILLAELWPIKYPLKSLDIAAEFTMTTPVVVSAFLSNGPSRSMMVTFLALFCAGAWSQFRQPFKKSLGWLVGMSIFNSSLYIISVASASAVFLACGGKTLAQGSNVSLSHLGWPLLCWVATLTTVNMMLFTTGMSLSLREPWRVHAAQSLMFYIPDYLVIGPSGILFAMLYSERGIVGILLVIIPFLVGRQAMNQHAIQLDTYRETITTLGSYMQHYHPYTKGHLERVADLAELIAREMRLPPQSLTHIHKAGLLHDIGKIGVDEEVLDKVGKLTDEEWNVIKQHPARGADILSQMKFLEPIVPWVRGHHERPDGRGYPDSLQGEDIPIEAAVIAVADAFDAMTGGSEDKDHRVYRKPLTIDQAMDQVRNGAGTQFDCRAVKAFLRVMAREENVHDS